jgi:hydroxyacylglutathione hydrolase
LSFAKTIEPDNQAVVKRLQRVEAARQAGKPSIPSTIEEECLTNPLLRWDAPRVIEQAHELGAADAEPEAVFAAIRRARDHF